MKRITSYIMLAIIIIGLIGCSSNNEFNDVDIFDMTRAKEVAINYIKFLSKGDIEKASELCIKEIREKENFEQFKDLKINSYKIIDDLEGSDHLIITLDISRTRYEDSRADLDRFTIKVIETEDGYKISEIKAETKGEVFEEEEKLRIIKTEDGASKLLLRKREIPEDIYPKEDGERLIKEKVPDGKFGTVTLGYERSSVAFTIVSEGSTFVGMASIKEAKETIGDNGDNGQGVSKGEGTVSDLEGLIEKSIADKIVGYDLLKGAMVEKMIFTQDDGQLVVQYKEDTGSFVRIYVNLEGALIPLELEQNFQRGKYNVEVNEIKKDEVVIDVSALGDETEKAGQYIVDIKKEIVTKR